MASRIYTVRFTPRVISPAVAPFDVFELVCGAGVRVRISEMFFLYDVSDPGDAARDMGRYEFYRGGSGYTVGNGTALVAADFEQSNSAEAATVCTGRQYSTTPASGAQLADLGGEWDTAANGWIWRRSANKYIFNTGEAAIFRMGTAIGRERLFRGHLVFIEDDV